MFPSIGRTANFNTATINGLKEVMSGDLDNFYSLSMGNENYSKLFGNTQSQTKQDPDEGKTAFNPTTNERIIKRGGKWVTMQ
jgi:hypothetical protein